MLPNSVPNIFAPVCKTIGASFFKTQSHLLENAIGVLEDLRLTSNFLRGLLDFKIRPDDIFVVTYPRSGTTLMQFLLYQLVNDSDLDFVHISEVAPWFERSLAVGSTNAADFENIRSPRIFKSHLAYQWIPKGGKYIYVTRAAEDVAVSYYHFYRSHLRFNGSFDEFFEFFAKGKVQYKSWFKHTSAWLTHKGDHCILFLDFDDLVNSMPTCLDKIAEFCGVKIDKNKKSQIIKRCSFFHMKQNESKFDFATELLLQKGYKLDSFLRQGIAGQGKATLTKEQRLALVQKRWKWNWLDLIELDLPSFLH